MSDRRSPGPGVGPEDVGLGEGDVLGGEGTQAAVAGALGGEPPLHQASLWSDAWKQLRRRPLFLFSAALILLFTAMAIAPGLFTDKDPNFCQLRGPSGDIQSAKPPGPGHVFGLDIQGCDYFARVVYGARVSLIIGLAVVAVDVLIGVALGSLSGFYGGKIDAITARISDIFFAIPTFLGGIVLLSVLGERGLIQVSLVLIALGWPTLMRLMRASVLSIKQSDYVQAARALGAGDLRIMRVHILPNAIAPVIVYGTITVGIIITAEASLSFIGVGLQLPEISWGLMISQSQSRVFTSPHLLLFPGLALSLLVFSFILLGDTLRDALDPRLR
jgi:oligopeptide transport system permease protein